MASKAVLITLKDAHHELQFAWDGFDGDDGFEDFRITVSARDTQPRVYEFGACIVRCARKMKEFLANSTVQETSGGFRHPDIRTYDLRRTGSEITLIVKFEGSGLDVSYVVKNPRVTLHEIPYSYH